jgi:hypothetical protein
MTKGGTHMKPIQALLALFACAFLPLHAASLDDLTWTTTGGEVTITDCKSGEGAEAASGELVIPNTIGGNPVTSIGDSAFDRCENLTSITIPDGVTSIGNGVFFSCGSLTSVTIPDSVTSIGYQAFGYCRSLTSITIPDSVTSIGARAFYSCRSLTSIGDYAFSNCRNLARITFLGTAPTVGQFAFSGVADGALAIVDSEELGSYKWNGLLLTDAPPQSLEVQLAQMTAERDAAITQRDAAITEREARPTQVAYDAVVTERDAFGVERVAVVAERDAAIAERDARPTQTIYNAVVTERDARDNTISLNTTMIESLNETITQKEAAYVTVVAERDARPTQVSYDSAVAASRVAGQDDVTTNPSNYNLTTGGEVTQTLDLKAGWNLVSFYVEADDMTPATVFTPIEDKLLMVKNLFHSYDPTLTADFAFLNTLSSLNMKDGYWIKVSEDVSLDVEGQVGTVVDSAAAAASPVPRRAIAQTQPDHSPEEKAGPTWGEATVYPNLGATVLAKVSIQGKPVAKGGVVAAFVGSELRGLQGVVLDNGISYVTLNVNLNGAESVSYRVWNPNDKNEYLVSGTTLLELGSVYGNPELVKLDAVTVVVSKPLEVFKLTSEPFGFSFNTALGRSYTVEATGNLRTWKAVELFQGSGGEIRFTAKQTSSGGAQFFRVFVK